MALCREHIDSVESYALFSCCSGRPSLAAPDNICFTLMTSFPLHSSRLSRTSIPQPALPVRSSPPLEKAIAPPLPLRTDRAARGQSNSLVRNVGDHLSPSETRPCPRPSSGGRKRVRIPVGTADGKDGLLGNVDAQRRDAVHSNTQSNGKIERWHKSLKSECIRPGTPLSLEDAKRLIQQYVDRYNNVRLHSAIGYVTPNDMLAGRQAKIHAERDRKLEAARLLRKSRRQQAA